MKLQSLADLAAVPGSALSGNHPVNKIDVQRWLSGSLDKKRDAQNTSITNSTRVDAAFDAVEFCALAVLAAQGYRVSSKTGHHKASLEGAAISMALSQSIVDEVDALKDWRNRKYRAAQEVSQQEVADALELVDRYLAQTLDWFQRRKPNLVKPDA